jgi:glycosyltransferase involved in cell wall biosynthesis
MLASARTDAIRIYTHRGGRIKYQRRRSARYRLTSPILRRRFHAVTGTAQATSAIHSLFGISKMHVHRTWNGVSLDGLTTHAVGAELRRKRGFAEDEVLIGTAAHLRRLKRIDLLIDAAETLDLSQRWRVVILGDGSDRSRLEHLAHSSPVAERIEFVGMQSDMGAWLSALDVFVLPSGPEESFGNAVVEAMSAAIPPIVFADSPALREHVVEGETGFLVETVDQLSDRLQLLIDDRALRQQLGRRAAEFAVSTYSMVEIVRHLDTIYELARLETPGTRGRK